MASDGSAPASRMALKRLAARKEVGDQEGPGFVLSRRGAKLRRLHGDEVEDTLLLGAACSEVFSGPRLAQVLRPALEHQRRTIEALEKDDAAEPLSIHTSAGVPAALSSFLQCLEAHLPKSPVDGNGEGKTNDWFVNLQVEGATAVWAGVEALAHLRQLASDEMNKECFLGVAEASYHGPVTTALGQPALPRWPNAPRSVGQVLYPVPPHSAATDGKVREAYLQQFDAFLTANPQVGVFLFEPQWGSSRLARMWPPELLREVIARCHAAGAFVLCDEVMCGLGRHGQKTLFLSAAWDLRCDAVTFGKSMASGVFPLSGVAVLHGANALGGKKLMQGHTYAGASTLAYLTATEILKTLPNWFGRANTLGCMVREILGPCEDDSFFGLYGQGFLWGGEFFDSKVVLKDVEEACHKKKVWPYIVASPHLGFMITPPMDIDQEDFRQGLERLKDVIIMLHEKK